MRNSARLAVATFVSALALVVLPVATADAAQVHEMTPYHLACCR
jgi:hypothetical protein